MQNVGTKESYKAFGLHILSDISFPELMKASEDQYSAEIEIVIDRFLRHGFNANTQSISVADGMVTLQTHDAGVFRIINGNKIIVSPYSWTDEDIIRLYILGTCMGILLLQRSIYPLHGSAVVISGKAYGFIGESGAGKSTLATAFVERGYKLLTDDIIPVTFSSIEKYPIVTPSYPQQKLWQQSLDAFGMDNEELRSIHGRATKFCVPVEERYCADRMSLAGIFELNMSESSENSLEAVNKLEKLPLLFKHTFRQFMIPSMNLSDWHFGLSAKIGNQIPIYRLHRSADGFSAPQLVDLILDTITVGE